jgi:hypothetical protein
MDVILDSNIILSDFKFQGTQFAELFAYLRRSGGKLVLPDLVVWEVKARYSEKLKDSINAARSSWSNLSATQMNEYPAFPRVKIQDEVKTLEEKLLNPSLGVEVLPYSKVDGVDVNEIARRGIKRLRPANSNGEELRDVIIWLLIFQYARTTGRPIALISRDQGFRASKEEDTLHPDLQREIDSEKLPIYFYREISAFVRSHSLSHHTVTESWVSQYVGDEKLRTEISNAMLERRLFTIGTPKKARVDQLSLSVGTEYQVSTDSVYVELMYDAKVTLTFPYSLGSIDDVSPFNSFVFQNIFPTMLNPAFQQPSRIWNHPMLLGPTVYSPNVAAGMLNSPNATTGTIYSTNLQVPGAFSGVAGTITYNPVSDIEKSFNCKISISLRIESGTLEKWQVDTISLQ